MLFHPKSVQTDRSLQDRSPTTDLNAFNFAQLHDLARHIIHTCEILDVAVDTVSELIGGDKSASDMSCDCGARTSAPAPVLKTYCPHKQMAFWLRMLRNFKRRSESLNARLSNEINLVCPPTIFEGILLMKTRASISSCSETVRSPWISAGRHRATLRQ